MVFKRSVPKQLEAELRSQLHRQNAFLEWSRKCTRIQENMEMQNMQKMQNMEMQGLRSPSAFALQGDGKVDRASSLGTLHAMLKKLTLFFWVLSGDTWGLEQF